MNMGSLPPEQGELVSDGKTPISSGPNPSIPSRLGRRVLLFEGMVLAEFWLSPLLFGIENYAGLWSTIGMILFGMFVLTLVGFVVVPLRRPLREVFLTRARRAGFAGVVGASVLVGLFATNTIQLVSGSGGAGAASQWTTVYTPFGAWTSLSFQLPALDLSGSLNVEVVGLLLLLGFLWASTLFLGPLRPLASCDRGPVRARGWRARVAPLLIWGPFGLISGCPSCAPAYIAGLALIAPGPATASYAAIPLVPWIGLAGLLYLASFGALLLLLQRTTSPKVTPEREPVEEVTA